MARSSRIVSWTALTICIDQAAKLGVRLLPERCLPRWISPIGNRDAAFGLIRGDEVDMVALSSLLLVAALLYFSRSTGRTARPPMVGLLIGGGMSNLADRLLFGEVLDFVTMPGTVFNLADLAIGIGAIWFFAFLARPLPIPNQA